MCMYMCVLIEGVRGIFTEVREATDDRLSSGAAVRVIADAAFINECLMKRSDALRAKNRGFLERDRR